jgi:hypothetical protein
MGPSFPKTLFFLRSIFMHKRSWFNLFLLLSLFLSMAVTPGAGRAQAPATPPPPELAQGGQPLSAVQQITMPAVDVEALLAEDLERLAAGLPQRFAQPIPVQLTPANSGTWESLPDGSWLWRLRIAGACLQPGLHLLDALRRPAVLVYARLSNHPRPFGG